MLRKKKIHVIYEDDAILVCEKPMGMPVQSDNTRDLDLLTCLKQKLYEEQDLDEEPYLAVVHRLDRPVGGVMVFAKTKAAAASLSEQIKNHDFEKNYQAVVCGDLPEEFGTFEDYLMKDSLKNTTKVVKAGTKGAKKAILDYELIDQIETKDGLLSWVMIELQTGRHHQIRVQFASRGCGLYGDTKYNKKYQNVKKKYMQLALYSTRIAFTHPVTGERVRYKVDPQGEGFDLMDVESF